MDNSSSSYMTDVDNIEDSPTTQNGEDSPTTENGEDGPTAENGDDGRRDYRPWFADPDGDLIIKHGGASWRLDRSLVQESGWFRSATQYIAADVAVVVVPEFYELEHPYAVHQLIQFRKDGGQSAQVVHHVLRFLLHGGKFDCKAWEDPPSFVTCVNTYFIAEFFDISELVEETISHVDHISKYVISINGPDRKPLWQDGVTAEKHHLRSFLKAVHATEIWFEWRPSLQKALYDSGERMAARLLELPVFQEFVSYEYGRNFARAIGIRDL